MHKSKRSHAYLVAAPSHLDDEMTLRKAVDELLIANPSFSISNFLETEFYKDEEVPRQLSIDLKKAGLPDTIAA